MFNWWTTRAENARKADDLYGAVVAQARNPLFYRDYRVPDTMTGRYELIVLHLAAVMERLSGSELAPAQTQPAQTQPAQTQPAQTQPAPTEPAVTEPAQTQPATAQPATTERPRTETVRLLVERFVTDMDDCMRELGVGDFTVPKRVKRAVAGLYERSALLRQVRENDADLAGLIADMIAAGQVFLPDEDEAPEAAGATISAPPGDGHQPATDVPLPRTAHCDSARLAAYVRQMQSLMAGQSGDRIAAGQVEFPDPATVFSPA